MPDKHRIDSAEQLAAVLGEPSEVVKQKVCSALDEPMREFIRRSPLIIYSTIDERGEPDVSPKGDAPGFVQIDDSGALLIPDRPGNKLAYGFRNLLRNPAIGLIFLVPTMRETLRVKGRAELTTDPALLERLGARGKPALVCTRVEVNECFFHCGKAMIRSRMWRPGEWVQHDDSLLVRQVARKLEADESLIETAVEDSYRDHLY